MADKSVSIRVRGIAELSRAFKSTSDDLPVEMKARFLEITQTIIGRAVAKMPRRSGKMAGSLKARATARGASIAAYGTAAPYGPFRDFGGTIPRRNSIRKTSRPFVRAGRFIYPTLTEMRPETLRSVDMAVRDVARTAGFDTSGEL